SQCFKRPRCTEQDYSVSYGQCELAPTKNTNKDKLMNEQQYQRTRSFFWNSPIVCDPSDVLSKPLPEAQIVQCAPCAPGTYRPIGATNCTACPKGTYRKSNQDNYQLNDESKCDECPAGHAAPQATYIKFPSSIKDQFDQFCEGDNGDRIGCESEGWRSSGDNLVVGGYHTDTHSSGSNECQCWCGCRGITAWLKLNVTVLPGEEGSVQFRFKPKIGKDSALIFYSTTSYNNPIVFDIDRLKQEGGDIEDERVVQVTLHPEDKTLNWIYIRRERYQSKMNKYDYINNDDGIPITHPTADTVSITSILLQNVDNAVGGSTECTACPSGTYSESIGAQKCEQCGKGYYSPKASQQCQICQEGYYQTRVKQETCEKCGGTTHSSLDRQHCELQEENICGFKESDQLRFNLDRINKKNGMWEARINDQQMRMNDDTSTGQQPSKYSELYNKWKTIPDNFVLRSDEGSKDWKAEEFYIRSGGFNQPGQSSFSFDVNIVQDKGELIFIYENSKYYGEQADLIFSLDGIEQRQFYLTSKEWKTVNIPLQFGRHTLTWTYELYSSSLGSEIFEENDPFDGARIRSIEIKGTSQLVLSCELCPSGQQSLNGICVDCQRDSFSNQTGSNSCQPCAKGYYSPAGSSQCFKRPRCTEQDYSVSYGQCELAPTKNTNSV
ncbi:MAG: hypothetical protein EZS28_036914, partial [Streblomastix strix]